LSRLAVRRAATRLNHLDFALLSIYWIAIGYLWSSLGGLILPDLVAHLVGNAHKGAALGVLEGVGSLMAVVWQPMAGSISDRWQSPWGRRRPFIVAGTVGALLLGRTLRALLFDVAPTDPAVLAAGAAAVAAVSLLASLLPARRATRVDPLIALREE